MGCGCVSVWWVGGRKRYVPLGWADGTTENRAAHDNARKQPCERGRGVGPGKGKRLPFERPPVPWPRRCVRDGDLSFCCCLLLCRLLLAARVCGLCVGVCICAPRFFHVSGWGAACSAGLLLFCQAGRGRVPGYIVLFLLLRRCCDAVLLCLEAGTLGHTPPLGNGVAWPMEVEVGIFSS